MSTVAVARERIVGIMELETRGRRGLEEERWSWEMRGAARGVKFEGEVKKLSASWRKIVRRRFRREM